MTHTVTVERIRIKVAVNGKTTVFDERVSRTVGFACDEIRLSQSGTIKMVIFKCLPHLLIVSIPELGNILRSCSNRSHYILR